MKKLRYFCLALLAASLVAIPAAAQNSEKGERNNNGTGAPKKHGQARAEEVQADNKKGDKDHKGGKKTHKGWAHSQHGGHRK